MQNKLNRKFQFLKLELRVLVKMNYHRHDINDNYLYNYLFII